jgi:hypothetical protein
LEILNVIHSEFWTPCGVEFRKVSLSFSLK